MVLSIILGLVLAQDPQVDLDREPPSLYKAVTVLPTGRNGYEDYLKGIDMLRDGDVLDAIAQIESTDSKTTFLEGERYLSTKFARALAAIRVGNGKPVENPRYTVEADTRFPELKWIEPAVRVFRAEAYVRFASGNALGGLQSLFDGIAFVSNLQGSGPLICYDAGVKPKAALFADVARQLQRSSLQELNAVETFATTRLQSKPPLVASLQIERIFIQETMDGLATGNWRFRRGVNLELLAEMDRMRIPARLTAQVEVNRAVVDAVRRWSEVLALPEAGWAAPEHPPYGEWGDRAVGPLFTSVSLAARNLIVERTRYRLAALTARVYRYLWEFERLPAKLTDAVPAEMLVDPVNGGPFEYEGLGEKTFRVFSKGVKGDGPIFLTDAEPTQPGKSTKGK